MIGGQAGIADHVTVGDLVMIAARAGLSRNVPAKEIIAGFPALPHMDWARAMAVVARLPELRQHLRAMDDRLKALEAKTSTKSVSKLKAASKPKTKPKRKR
jgi:UDP-3-O-[3-hydroxymyristoyl] glucosamine N-acyltransferase